MQKRRELRAALALTATALGVHFVSGRSIAAFYAQLGKASWLGVAVSALIFGGFMALLAALSRRCGARSMPELLRRAPGGGFGWMATALYLLIAVGGLVMALVSAGRVGALMLPVRHASLYAAALCLLFALALALGGTAAICASGAAFCICELCYLLMLLFSMRSPDVAVLRWALELRLENNLAAALLLALLHSCTMVCMAAGAAVRLANGRLRTCALGGFSALAYLVLLALGNAVLRAQADELLALRLPFVALASGWGTAGFYLSGGMVYFAAVSSAAGLLFALVPKHKCLNLIEK